MIEFSSLNIIDSLMDNETITVGQTGVLTNIGGFLGQVYLWLTMGLIITASVAFGMYWMINTSDAFYIFMVQNYWILPASLFAQVILMFVIYAVSRTSNVAVLATLLASYAGLLGITTFFITAQYSPTAVARAFIISAALFAVMSFVGYVTKRDVTRIENLAIMGIIGVIIGTLFNIFIGSTLIDMGLSLLSIFFFLILVATNTSQLRQYGYMAEHSKESTRFALLGALNLYLDFINLFFRILGLTGRRRD